MIEAIERLVKDRADAMKKGDTNLANSIQKELARFNVKLVDLKDGTWYEIG